MWNLKYDRYEVRGQSLSRVRHCDSMDCSPTGSSVHGILQARILEWEAPTKMNVSTKHKQAHRHREQT